MRIPLFSKNGGTAKDPVCDMDVDTKSPGGGSCQARDGASDHGLFSAALWRRRAGPAAAAPSATRKSQKRRSEFFTQELITILKLIDILDIQSYQKPIMNNKFSGKNILPSTEATALEVDCVYVNPLAIIVSPPVVAPVVKPKQF